MFEVRIPSLGESVTEATITRWAKADGDTVGPDDVILELESDKAATELPAEHAGTLRILKHEGATVVPGDVVARIEDGDTRSAAPPKAAAPAPSPSAAPAPAQAAAAPKPAETVPEPVTSAPPPARGVGPMSPAVRNLIDEHGLDPAAITASGKGGRLT